MLFSYYERPGLHWSRQQTVTFVDKLREVATLSFGLTSPDLLPQYQCLVYDGLNDKIIVVASDPSGHLLGFLSSVLLPIPGLQHPVIHMGLMCARPEALSHGLTQRLTSRLLRGYLTNHVDALLGLRKIWFTNTACVCRTLGAIALELDMVYPSPQFPPSNGPPSKTHVLIAETIATSDTLRRALYIPPSSEYDKTTSVFRGSVPGTIFMKEKEDERYHHRDPEITKFYQELMNWENGDEVLQVGMLSVWALVAHWKKTLAKL
ncbi:uncharacterized protein STEHIDRAFT_138514 [Stereum hirsutum FP-91666 SS1]|uniref:uncharacterized protein n=1 Tax=Stereum hirsutum (strain FP-91666) TaxID=721885 RepID=UPI000440B956|nr:uncharacterized protein STEHIDRAFT_138514 [Stereum hirsutum FP-91666 SS1]EIM88044.1 hypothetical protein STEHIDRAFT_138514 [Stereum hirsutum FP-91666 SS1]